MPRLLLSLQIPMISIFQAILKSTWGCGCALRILTAVCVIVKAPAAGAHLDQTWKHFFMAIFTESRMPKCPIVSCMFQVPIARHLPRKGCRVLSLQSPKCLATFSNLWSTPNFLDDRPLLRSKVRVFLFVPLLQPLVLFLRPGDSRKWSLFAVFAVRESEPGGMEWWTGKANPWRWRRRWWRVSAVIECQPWINKPRLRLWLIGRVP